MNRKLIFIISSSILSVLLITLTVVALYVFNSEMMSTGQSGTITYDSSTDFVMYYTPEVSTEDGTEQVTRATSLTPEGKENLTNDVYGYQESTRVLTCYASRKSGYSDEEDFIYLNQLGFGFQYSSNIDTMFRINVRSSWISHKVYLNGTVVNNVMPKAVKVSDMFGITETDENYYCDDDTEYIYFKSVVDASEVAQIYNFNCDPTYYYTPETTTSYREYIIVQITFEVDIFQANRALDKWSLEKFPWNN